jgi:hypothetical protein
MSANRKSPGGSNDANDAGSFDSVRLAPQLATAMSRGVWGRESFELRIWSAVTKMDSGDQRDLDVALRARDAGSIQGVSRAWVKQKIISSTIWSSGSFGKCA